MKTMSAFYTICVNIMCEKNSNTRRPKIIRPVSNESYRIVTQVMKIMRVLQVGLFVRLKCDIS